MQQRVGLTPMDWPTLGAGAGRWAGPGHGLHRATFCNYCRAPQSARLGVLCTQTGTLPCWFKKRSPALSLLQREWKERAWGAPRPQNTCCMSFLFNKLFTFITSSFPNVVRGVRTCTLHKYVLTVTAFPAPAPSPPQDKL